MLSLTQLDGTRRAAVDRYASAYSDLDLWAFDPKVKSADLRIQNTSATKNSFIGFWDTVFTQFFGLLLMSGGVPGQLAVSLQVT